MSGLTRWRRIWGWERGLVARRASERRRWQGGGAQAGQGGIACAGGTSSRGSTIRGTQTRTWTRIFWTRSIPRNDWAGDRSVLWAWVLNVRVCPCNQSNIQTAIFFCDLRATRCQPPCTFALVVRCASDRRITTAIRIGLIIMQALLLVGVVMEGRKGGKSKKMV